MTTINNGSIGFGGISTTSSGSPTLGTTLFGVDIQTLVESLVQARGLQNLKRQDKIDANTAKLGTYSTLQGLLGALNSAASTLRNPVVTNGASDIFNARQVLSTASGSIPAASLYGASTSDNAVLGTYSLTINRIATSDTIHSTDSLPDQDTTAVLGEDRILTINGVDVSLTATDTLTDIKNAINARTTDTDVSASILKVSATDYRLVLKANSTGQAITLSDPNAQGSHNTLSLLGIAESGQTDQDLSAELVLDGTTLYRASNSVNDLIDGVSLELFQADPGHPVTLTVDNNLSAMSQAISGFLDAYNAVVDFVAQQRKVDASGTIGSDQYLYNDNFMLSTYRELQSFISEGALGVTAGDLKTLRDIGITIDSSNHLVVTDNNKLEDALIGSLDQVKSLFGFNAAESAGLLVLDRPDSLDPTILAQAVTVRVSATDANGVPTAAEFEVGGNIIAATIENGFIKGVSGTELEGFVVAYSGGVVGATPYEGTITPTQGIADRIGALLESALDSQTGDLKAVTDQVTDSSTRLQTQIDALNTQLDLYRNRLLLQFQAAQEAIALLQNFQNSIQSTVDSWNAKN